MAKKTAKPEQRLSNHQEAVQHFIRRMESIDHSRNVREKFRDWCEMCYCAWAKLTAPDQQRADALEARYMKIVEGYQDKTIIREVYPALRALAEEEVGGVTTYDFLGVISSQLGVLSASQGQFFTPWEVSRMMAHISVDDDVKTRIKEYGYIRLYEPAAGAGGMVLAAAEILREKGFNPFFNMLVWASDLSTLAYHMCYLQLTWAGVPAWVEKRNSLSMEFFEGAWTLGALMFRGHHGHTSFEEPEKKRSVEDMEQTIMAMKRILSEMYDQPETEEKEYQLGLF